MDRRRFKDEFALLRAAILENSTYLSEDAPRALHDIERCSQSFHIRERLIDIAIQQAKDAGLAFPDAEGRILDAAELAGDLAFPFMFGSGFFSKRNAGSLTEKDVRAAFRMTYSSPGQNLLHDIESGGPLQVDRDSFLSAVARYLDGCIRDTEIEKVLLTALTDMEITAFVHEMTQKNFITRKSQLGESRKGSLLWLWFVGRLRGLLYTILLIAGTIASHVYLKFPSENVTVIISSVLACLFAIATLATFIGAIFHSKEYDGKRQYLIEMVGDMTALYWEMHAAGPLSLAHLRERFTALKERKAVWPNGVWALLEDLEDRGIKRI